jgi:hypothetical protein
MRIAQSMSRLQSLYKLSEIPSIHNKQFLGLSLRGFRCFLISSECLYDYRPLFLFVPEAIKFKPLIVREQVALTIIVAVKSKMLLNQVLTEFFCESFNL